MIKEAMCQQDLCQLLVKAGMEIDTDINSMAMLLYPSIHPKKPKYICSFAQAMRWLREKKQLSIEVHYGQHFITPTPCWYCEIIKMEEDGHRVLLENFCHNSIVFDTYEDAVEAGIRNCLTEILKVKDDSNEH